ncbi:zinc finger domain-containing protein [Streptosporangium sp. CA-135522]|uniref:zinc finger domain-containing protein n=1 Tax=Streptosporangium sp. CA-135522 TaxID=3240072 RepID=UPI003D8B54F2
MGISQCGVKAGSPCRSHGGAVAGTYHTGRFTQVARMAELLRVRTPADRGPGQPWRPGTRHRSQPTALPPSADLLPRDAQHPCGHRNDDPHEH